MADDTHVSEEEFVVALEQLDRSEFAAFVGELWRGGSEEVTVDPPVVTVESGSEQIELLAVTDERDLSDEIERVDAVVASSSELGEHEADPPIVGPSDLRQRLLYAMSPAEAEELAEQFLDRPARPSRTTAEGVSNEVATQFTDDEPDGILDAGRRLLTTVTNSRIQVVAIVVLVVALLGAGGVVVLGGDSQPVDGSDRNDGSDVETPQATQTPRDGQPEEETSVETPMATTLEASNESESNRYADFKPTCNRSYLHVVQIQMNALKYNDPERKDGIRVVRRFASPRNRRYVGSLDQYVQIINSPAYAPMLSYDSVTYTPERIDETTAQVKVATREDGKKTGEYIFRLRKLRRQPYDGCWMTDGAQALYQTSASSSFSSPTPSTSSAPPGSNDSSRRSPKRTRPSRSSTPSLPGFSKNWRLGS